MSRRTTSRSPQERVSALIENLVAPGACGFRRGRLPAQPVHVDGDPALLEPGGHAIAKVRDTRVGIAPDDLTGTQVPACPFPDISVPHA